MYNEIIELTSEEKLLLSLCRPDFTEKQKMEIGEHIKYVKNWDYFLNLANEHGIIALCWYNLTKTSNSNNVSTGQMEILHSYYLKNLLRNTFLFKQLEEIASLSEKENIRIVLLKGLALERTVYGNKGIRQMNDIDLLVSKDKAVLLRKILLNNGFESAPLVSSFHEKIMPVYGKHLPEMYKNGIAVEIHFNLFNQKDNSITEDLLDKTIILCENEPCIYQPDPFLFFLYLVKHLNWHETNGMSQLRLYVDLLFLLSHYYDQIINEQLRDYSERVSLWNTLCEKLIILNLIWGVPLPECITGSFREYDIEKIKDIFVRFLRSHTKDKLEEKHEDLFKLLNEVPDLKNKFLLILGHIFPSITYIRYRYKIRTRSGAILYIPVRWVNQLGRIITILNQKSGNAKITR